MSEVFSPVHLACKAIMNFLLQEEEKKKKEEREKASLERKYALPDNPLIIVHPNSVAKAGKFDCSLMSLSVLLDYRPEDNKEHSFEAREEIRVTISVKIC